MKIHIMSDSAYPVYGFWEATEHDRHSVELTDEDVIWCKRVESEYNKMQEFLGKKHDEQWRNSR
jgi:hypothetical protein